MTPRSHLPAEERNARSRLAQLIGDRPFLRGSLVERSRSCGKPACRCRRGQPHRSLYLATRHQGQRVLLYVPRALEEDVRLRVANGRELARQIQELHQTQLDHLLQAKRRASRPRATPGADSPGRPS